VTKRFTMVDWNEYAEGDTLYYDNGKEMGSLDVLDMLNTLHEENKNLKLDKTNLHQAMSRDRVKYLQFRDKVVNSIDTKIKQFKESGMSYEAQILDDLRRELFE